MNRVKSKRGSLLTIIMIVSAAISILMFFFWFTGLIIAITVTGTSCLANIIYEFYSQGKQLKQTNVQGVRVASSHSPILAQTTSNP